MVNASGAAGAGLKKERRAKAAAKPYTAYGSLGTAIRNGGSLGQRVLFTSESRIAQIAIWSTLGCLLQLDAVVRF